MQAVQGDRVGTRWDDDGTASGWIQASELGWIYPEVAVGEEAFTTACRARVSGWFATLRPDLVEERSCIADLCAACGL